MPLNVGVGSDHLHVQHAAIDLLSCWLNKLSKTRGRRLRRWGNGHAAEAAAFSRITKLSELLNPSHDAVMRQVLGLSCCRGGSGPDSEVAGQLNYWDICSWRWMERGADDGLHASEENHIACCALICKQWKAEQHGTKLVTYGLYCLPSPLCLCSCAVRTGLKCKNCFAGAVDQPAAECRVRCCPPPAPLPRRGTTRVPGSCAVAVPARLAMASYDELLRLPGSSYHHAFPLCMAPRLQVRKYLVNQKPDHTAGLRLRYSEKTCMRVWQSNHCTRTAAHLELVAYSSAFG